MFIDKNDIICVADSQSDQKTNPGFKQEIRIGSAKDGKVTAFIPLSDPQLQAAEEVTADDQGNVYGGFTSKRNLNLRRSFRAAGPYIAGTEGEACGGGLGGKNDALRPNNIIFWDETL